MRRRIVIRVSPGIVCLALAGLAQSQDLPDLTILGDPQLMMLGIDQREVIFAAEAGNIGTADAERVTVAFEVSSGAGGAFKSLGAGERVRLLPAGGSKWVFKQAKLAAGCYVLRVIVDGRNTIAESNEDNNLVEIPFCKP